MRVRAISVSEFVISHSLGLSVVLFVLCCTIAPYRVSWRYNDDSGNSAIGYFFLFSPPSETECVAQILNTLPIHYWDYRPKPKFELERDELLENNRWNIQKQISNAQEANSITLKQNLYKGVGPGTTPESTSSDNQLSSDSEKVNDELGPRREGESVEDFVERVRRVSANVASATTAEHSRPLRIRPYTELLQEARERQHGALPIPAKTMIAIDSNWPGKQAALDQITQDSIEYRRSGIERDHQIACGRIARDVHAVVKLDLSRQLPQIVFGMTLLLITALKRNQ